MRAGFSYNHTDGPAYRQEAGRNLSAGRTMKERTKKWITTGVVVVINAVGWAIPSDVTYLVMQQRDVLLGRYGVDKVTGLLILAIVSAFYLYLTWSNEKNRKQRQFKTMALSLSIVLSLVVGDIFLRVVRSRQYVGAESLYHRAPNQVQKGTFVDEPEKAFAYANMPQGYSDVEYTLTVDKRGFRNSTDLEQYDVVVLGDSFTEGSSVSDEHAWPAVLAERSGRSVYNLGMSGGSPVTYVNTLEEFGIGLGPKVVICMLYEGNDFRDSNFEEEGGLSSLFETIYDASPLRHLIKNSLIRLLSTEVKLEGAGGDAGAAKPSGPGSWLPVAIPAGGEGRYYSFKVKRLLQHYHTAEEFAKTAAYRQTTAEIRRMKEVCEKNGVRFVLVFAPDKPHVLLPLLKDSVTSEELHEFMALKEDKLPAPEKAMEVMVERAEVQEEAMADFCRGEGIDFVSLTRSMREAIAAGRQAYYTYDQHWTPLGQEIAADTIYEYLKESE